MTTEPAPQLPPLPEPRLRFDKDVSVILGGKAYRYAKDDPIFTAEQMREYGLASSLAALPQTPGRRTQREC